MTKRDAYIEEVHHYDNATLVDKFKGASAVPAPAGKGNNE